MTDEATAFVPGHVTGFFSAHSHDDPLQAGSRGAGLTLSHGVEVTVEPSDGTDSTTTLDGDPVEMPPVERVLAGLGVDAAVRAETELPLGAGFGVSGAMALGTALAANTVFGCARSENELVALAHAAEVRSGTGLGDVVAQARGGMPVRLDPGAPDHGRLDGVPARPDIEYVTFGELSTEEVLSGDTDRLSAAGEDALALLAEEPTPAQFMYASRRFAREAGLLTDEVTETIRAVSEAGGEASMAMLGRTVFALGTGLSDAGYDAVSCRTHPAGATLR
ncbi:pantoate kinase [Halogranum gelatinilyticum]|uniref:Pantoate kinase n=1 Tax=Halogranum gelatinilyticum TaxID=660521 RepID=A0A1G9QC31_9EURY|nr:pantoate kinase [Halogranum gelatinilyticum]SDM08539.1 pantoate kinase [Halogranum gelatinilyticum]